MAHRLSVLGSEKTPRHLIRVNDILSKDEKYPYCNNQSLKGAVVVTFCQNEAKVKFQMDIDQLISLTEKAGAMTLIFPACSIVKVQFLVKYSLGQQYV